MFRRRPKKNRPIPAWMTWITERQWRYVFRLSRYLQAKVEKAPRRRVKFFLVLLLAGFLGANVVILLKAVNERPEVSIPDPVRLPRGLLPPRHHSHPPVFFLDSLVKDSTVKRAYDSLLKTRPGLADSLRQLQNLK